MTTPNPSLQRNPQLDSWIAIDRDGTVQVRTGKVDIGQKISRALQLLVSEGLGLAPDRVIMVAADTVAGPDEGMTSGSNSMEESGNALRAAAATARRHILESAARHLDVDAGTLDLSDGIITSRATNRTTSLQEIQGGCRFGVPVDPAAPGISVARTGATGSPGPAPDLVDIVTGRHQFVQDMNRPGMLHARVIRPPHRHARLAGLPEAAVSAFTATGIRVVRDGSFLAVAGAEETDVVDAAQVLARRARWRAERDLGSGDIFELLTRNDRVSLPVIDGFPVNRPVPDPPSTPDDAVVSLSARYERPYIMHAAIGPSAALAQMTEDTLQVWTHSQGIYPLRGSMAEALDMPEACIEIYHRPGPGCYGHNGADDAAFDAALIARAVPHTPILLQWTRADEHGWEPYSPAMVMQLSGSIAADGSVTAWRHETFSDTHIGRPRTGRKGEGAARLLANRHRADPAPEPVPQPLMAHHGGIHRNLEPLYRFGETFLVKHLVRDLPHRTSALRTLGAFANVFAAESFLDELAIAAGIDPLELRLRHLADSRGAACLRAAADRLGPVDDTADGVGRGLAFARYKNTKAYAAVGVELTVDAAARIRLVRAVIAGDAGHIVDPAGVRAQLEGGFVQAASWTLLEAVTHAPDGITSLDWDSYPIIRFDAIPEIETILLDQPGSGFLGVGEAVCGPTAAAIANAVYRATGVRARRLPLTADNLRQAALA